MSYATFDATQTNSGLVKDAGKTLRANAKVTTNTSYDEGDLLVLSAANVLTKATDPAVWDVIAAETVTAAQATAMANSSTKMAVYYGGCFNINAVTLGGVVLAANQKDAAQSRATKNRIEIQ